MRRIPVTAALALAGLVLAALPAIAGVPALADLEVDPKVDRSQTARVLCEVAFASLHSIVREPLGATSRIAGRSLERLSVRVQTLACCLRHPASACAHSADPNELGGVHGGLSTPAKIILHPSSEASIQALLGLVSTAGRRIDLMMYGWGDDPTGREVAEALSLAATRGVRVRLMVDRTSHLIHNPAASHGGSTFLDVLKRVPNIAVIETPGPCLSFDHRKLAVVDGRVAWAGGMILTEAARSRWHNLAFTALGPIVGQYACVFEEAWRDAGGHPQGPDQVIASPCTDRPNATVRLVQTNHGDRSLRDSIYHAVDHARSHIYLENPYFSDGILTAKLRAARARGVDVRAVLTVRGNVPRLNRYVTLTANRLHQAGVRVYLYPAMTHVKAMSADGVWAYLGSGNLDELSLRNNREAGLSITSPELVGELDRSLFLTDMSGSQELSAPLPSPREWLELELWSLWY